MQPLVFVILDGFGHRSDADDNAITRAYMPTYKSWCSDYYATTIAASGAAVGLLPGMIGNSEAGHTTIGAGYAVPQAVSRIHAAIDDGSLYHNATLTHLLHLLSKRSHALHIICMLSDSGIHAHTKHLYAYLDVARSYNISRIVVHAILDGRDCPPQSAAIYLTMLEHYINEHSSVVLGTIHGRFYAMDRDQNWERTHKSHYVLTQSQVPITSWQEVLAASYKSGITDEFIYPTACHEQHTIKHGDVILCANFRPERSVQLLQSLIDPHFKFFKRTNIFVAACITPTHYPHLETAVLFNMPVIEHTLKELISAKGLRQFVIAETEKYAHVTYFLSGSRIAPFAQEKQILIPSRKVRTYAEYPCMSAPEITRTVISSLREDTHDIYIINYANADMVGHSGNMQATMQALTCLDEQLKELYTYAVCIMKGTLIITADHGKAEEMWDANAAQPRTAHTCNPVPFMVIPTSRNIQSLPDQLSEIKEWIIRYINTY